jgi:hypothetical protein
MINMKKALKLWDTHMQRGALGSIALGAGAVIVLLVFAHGGGDPYLTLFFALLGLVWTWQEVVVWRRRRDQGGLELLGTRRKLEEEGL